MKTPELKAEQNIFDHFDKLYCRELTKHYSSCSYTLKTTIT